MKPATDSHLARGHSPDARALQARGVALTALGVLLISPDALLLRLADVADGPLVFWRGLLTAIGFALILLLTQRGGPGQRFISALARMRGCGRTGLWVALLFTGSTLGFVLANQYTRAGNVLIILAASPLFAALMSRLWLGERQPRHVWGAILVSLAGITLLVMDEAGSGSLSGNLLALGCSLSLAGNFTLCRTRPGLDMSPMLTLSGLLTALCGLLACIWLAASGGGVGEGAAEGLESVLTQLWPSHSDDFAQRAGWLVLLCLVLSPLGFTLIQRGPLYLPSAEVALLMLLESVFGILWVWWVLDESLTLRGWVGGAMVLGAMLIKSLIDRRLRHLQATRAPSADASAGGN
ncbi:MULTISPECIES: DMT family transporter [unclassified Cobetia]|uniref:DMT family transporter n=1 Tax=unclassified Cobetia TaxID=2609414 RepID=UPI0020976C6C|nr:MULTISPECIES: DMT family transporter [unclassified Cobetia]MCO7231369.1 DMT family transporter [Cobetia sp. Dlab-2-AX]MCO7234222.1 DMT family transporter [Cobetia sp. Dlab-2-U]